MFGHKWVKFRITTGFGLGMKLVQRHSCLNHKGGRRRNQLVHKRSTTYYICKRCMLTTSKLRKGEQVYESH